MLSAAHGDSFRLETRCKKYYSTGICLRDTHILHSSAIPSEQDIETAQYALNSVRNDIRQRLAEAARRDNTPVGFVSGEGLQLNLQGRVVPGCHE